MKFLKFILKRTFTFLLIILIGMTSVFFLIRLMPTDPIEIMLSNMQAESGVIDPDAMEQMRAVLSQNFGLEGTLQEQYTGFLKRVLITQDFGPSLSKYPTPVTELIGRALPWTIGLLVTSVIMSWIIGNIIGLLAGFKKEKASSKILESIAVILYPMPYYVIALLLIILLAYVFPVFPLVTVVTGTGWTLKHILEIIHNSILPALSLVLVNTGWWVISMKTLSLGIAEEDYVTFAKIKGLSKSNIMRRYIAPNAMLPQVTALALRIGLVFSGAVILETLFGYPGIGLLLYNAVLSADYNLIMGAITVSVLAVSVMTYIIDIMYPLLDPRIRQN